MTKENLIEIIDKRIEEAEQRSEKLKSIPMLHHQAIGEAQGYWNIKQYLLSNDITAESK